MTKLKIGVIGAGMISQVEHIPNLLALRERFEVVGVADPSKASRDFVTATHDVPGFAGVEELLDQDLDAVVIGSPDPLHFEQVMAALERGLHVFCEKPLCYSPAEIGEIVAARDQAGTFVQVGYMKRFDPNYRLALESLPGTAAKLRYVAVEVNDPDAWPFIAHRPYFRGTDIARDLIDATIAKQRAQVTGALGVEAAGLAYKGFTGAYASALIHDINAVHGLLDALGVSDGEIVGGELFAGGDGGQGTVRLLGGQALWNMVHLTVPKLADYKERITLFFDDASLELEFPSPWLNHQPTRLTIRTSDGHTASKQELRAGYGEAFVEELIGFHAAITAGAAVVNPPEHAARDMKLLIGMTRHFLGLKTEG
jgi:predicted dehydrogenase